MSSTPDNREPNSSASGTGTIDRLLNTPLSRRRLFGVAAGATAAVLTGGLPHISEASSTTQIDGTDILGTPEPENPAKTAIEKALKVSSKDLFNVSNSFRWELDAFNGIMVQDPLIWIDSSTKDFVYPMFVDEEPVQIPYTTLPYYFARKDNRNEFMPHKGIVTVPGKGTRGDEEDFFVRVSVIPVAREVKSLDTGDPNADPIDVDILYGLLHSGGKKLILPFYLGWKNAKTGEESPRGYGIITSATRGIRDADRGTGSQGRDEVLAVIDENMSKSSINFGLGNDSFAADIGWEDRYPPMYTADAMTRRAKKTENLYRALANREMDYVEKSDVYTAYGLDLATPQEPQPTEISEIYNPDYYRETSGNEIPKLPSWKHVNRNTTITLNELLDTIPTAGAAITIAPSNYTIFPK